MPNLNQIPAFGYETSKNHFESLDSAKETYERAKRLYESGGPKILYDDAKWALEKAQKETTKNWKGRNVRKVLGSIPLIGTFIGIFDGIKTVHSAHKTRQWTPNHIKWIVRSVVETLSLGFLLLIPDLIMTKLLGKEKKIAKEPIAPIQEIIRPNLVNKTIGSKEMPLSENEILTEINKLWQSTPTPEIDVLTIYAKAEVNILKAFGISILNPQKIILVGGKLLHEPCDTDPLDEALSRLEQWQGRWGNHGNGGSFIQQINMPSVEAALLDTPPLMPNKNSRYHAFYTVKT